MNIDYTPYVHSSTKAQLFNHPKASEAELSVLSQKKTHITSVLFFKKLCHEIVLDCSLLLKV